jgi:hypothetical protein
MLPDLSLEVFLGGIRPSGTEFSTTSIEYRMDEPVEDIRDAYRILVWKC